MFVTLCSRFVKPPFFSSICSNMVVSPNKNVFLLLSSTLLNFLYHPIIFIFQKPQYVRVVKILRNDCHWLKKSRNGLPDRTFCPPNKSLTKTLWLKMIARIRKVVRNLLLHGRENYSSTGNRTPSYRAH